MDLNWARILFTVVVFVFFMWVLFTAFRKRNKADYQNAAQSIIDDEDTPQS